jgi:hypothetical protein
LSNQVVKIHLIDEKFFKGIKIEDLLKKKDSQERVWQTLKNMLKFNVWVESVLVFNEQGYLEVRDTEVKEY